MEKSAKAVADHSAYSEAYQKAVDWLSATEEQLKTISDSRWDSLEAVMHELNLIKVQPFTFHFYLIWDTIYLCFDIFR